MLPKLHVQVKVKQDDAVEADAENKVKVEETAQAEANDKVESDGGADAAAAGSDTTEVTFKVMKLHDYEGQYKQEFGECFRKRQLCYSMTSYAVSLVHHRSCTGVSCVCVQRRSDARWR